MATFMISFRIKEIGDHESRREMLNIAIQAAADTYWDQTTSFYVITASNSTSGLIEHLKTFIDDKHDIVLVRSLESKIAYVAGNVTDNDLFLIMPYCKKA
ncbi:hypothetical protein [Methylobacterium indicum]|uniref:hypothetical protein n=1 Tax=Methylobacterium indicum TaxID=1775910 RepID=UPI002434F538|nr:hypothetical protein [Methylobacterium indicum]